MGHRTNNKSLESSPKVVGGVRKTMVRRASGRMHKVINGKVISTIVLGRGSYSKVFSGEDECGRQFAVKVTEHCSYEFSKTVSAEETSLRVLTHKNIVKFYESCKEGKFTYLFLEKIDGQDLWKFIQKRLPSEDEVREIFSQIILAVEHCHSHNISHRDIKLENLLLEPSGTVKLIDFGLSAKFANPIDTDYVGSPFYMCMQKINKQPHNPFLSDIWSLGVVLYVLNTGNFPYLADCLPDLAFAIENDDIDYPDSMSAELVDLLKRLLEKDPSQRSGFKEIKDHRWMTGASA
jgi:serine/threonine protein kinase